MRLHTSLLIVAFRQWSLSWQGRCGFVVWPQAFGDGGWQVRISAGSFEDALRDYFPRGLEKLRDFATSARWATYEETTSPNWRYGSTVGMMFLGYRGDVPIGRRDDRHQTTIGGSRGFKGVSLINPCLITYEGSVLAIDPKGELARLTVPARIKRLRQDCYVLDPFGESGVPSFSFNPLAEIKEYVPELPKVRYPYAVDDAASMADALIVPSGNDAHWTDSAKILLHALILLTLAQEQTEDFPDDRNLVTVRDFLMLKHGAVLHDASVSTDFPNNREVALFRLMEQCTAFDGLVSGVGAAFLSMSEKERASILSSARTQTAFLDSPALQSVLQKSDFSLADLKRKATTVYLCLPASYMGTHSKWLRTIITLAVRACEREKVAWKHPSNGKPIPVLFVLDEFAVLGHMRAIEAAAGQMAGFGVKLWVILQDLGQLQTHYEKSWETFFGNSAIATFQSISDLTTLKYLSERLGTRTFYMPIDSGVGVRAKMDGAKSENETVQTAPLLATHEIEYALARERGAMIVLFSGMHPLILQRAISYADPFFTERLK